MPKLPVTNNKRAFKNVAMALSCLLSVTVEAGESLTAEQWLENMSVAMKALNYQGTVAFMKNGHLDTMKYFHRNDNGTEQEHLISLNSPMREVIRKNGEISCVYKESQQKVINHHPLNRSFIVDVPPQLQHLDAVYQLSLAGEEAIAMRSTQVVSIKPKDDLRYSRKLWIDQQQFLPLKVEVYNPAGETVEQVVFADLQQQEVTLPPEPLALHDHNMTVKHIHHQHAEAFENASFVLNTVPMGFEPVFFTRSSMRKTTSPVEHLLISDGFASVSIYREKKRQGVNGLHSLGSVNSFSQTIGDSQLTVLGEVPAKTVEAIARGVVLKKQHQ